MWSAFVAHDYIKASREIAARESISNLTAPIGGTIDLVFDPNVDLAVSAKKYIVGGRIFAGDYEMVVVQ